MFKSLRLFFLIIGSCFILTSTASAADMPKIGIVDFQKIIESSEKGKAASETLNKEAEKMRADLEKQSAELKEMKESFDKEAAVLSDEKRKEKEGKLNAKLVKFRETQKKYNDDTGKLYQELMVEIQKKIVTVIEGIGKKEGYSLIVEKVQGGVLYSAGIDITDKVIKGYNSLK
ncbi:MAG: OmpH family outer membrane protein [Deltaproteobacteria bacterium]|nr:OmpH family outer membrane protein [Deltaproteobacteria bacterium]